MNIDKEIEKIIEYQNSLLPLQKRKVSQVIIEIKKSYKKTLIFQG